MSSLFKYRNASTAYVIGLLFTISSIFVSFSCTPGTTARGGASDSTMMSTQKYEVKKIYIGPHISNSPLCSQVATIGGKDKYLMLDESHIYIFDWESGNLEDSIPTKACGELSNYSGFTFISTDSIVVYNDAQRKTFIIDKTGKILSECAVPTDPDNTTNNVSIVALNASRANVYGSNVLLSGGMLGCLNMAKGMGITKIPVSESVDLTNGKAKIAAYYPSVYLDSNWGTNYLNQVYTARDSKGNTLFSYPVMDKVLRYNSNFTKCDTIFMQSRYGQAIEPCKLSQEKIEEDETLEINYYISQTSYSNILFDPYRNLYIRMVEHPLDKWNVKETFVKPMSFIIADTEGNVLSETPIISGSTKFLSSNMHVTKDGLAIATQNPDEDNIYFACFKINK